MSNRLALRTLGGLHITLGGQELSFRTKKAKALLVYLACEGGFHPRPKLADIFFGDPPYADPRARLRQILTYLRHAIGDVLTQEGDSFGLQGDWWVDVADLMLDYVVPQDVMRLETVLNSIHGQFLDSYHVGKANAFEAWMRDYRTSIADRVRTLRVRLIEHYQAMQAYSHGIPHARALTAANLCDDDGNYHLMALLALNGQRAEAMEYYHECRRAYGDLLGIDPPQELIVLYDAILAEEHRPQTYTHNVLLIQEPRAVPWRARRLFGRDDLLTQVEALLADGGRVTLQGMGGIGKTTLAAEVVARHLERDGGSALWLEGGEADLDSMLEGLAMPFQGYQSVATASVDRRLQFIARHLTEAEVSLVVLDDVGDGVPVATVARAIPPQTALLITSRLRLAVHRLVEVSELAPGAAVELLAYHADLPQAGSEALALCRLLGFHPYALEIAGKNMLVDVVSPAELRRRIHTAPDTLPMPGGLVPTERSSVRVLLRVSVHSLSPEAQHVFGAFGALAAPHSSVMLLTLILDQDQCVVAACLREMAQRGLATTIPASTEALTRFRLHDLAHSYARAHKRVADRQVVAGTFAFVQHYYEDVPTLDAERENLLAAAWTAYHQLGDSRQLVKIMGLLAVEGTYLKARGYSALMLELLDNAIEAARQLDDRVALHYFLGKRGDAYREQGDRPSALLLYEESAALAHELEMPVREVILLCVMVAAHMDLGHYQAVDALGERAYRIALETDDDLALMRVLQTRGYCAFVRQDYETALVFFVQKLELARRGDDVLELFYALLNVGGVQQDLGNHDEALAVLEEALAVADTANNRVWRGNVRFTMGISYFRTGSAQACECFREALAIFRETGMTDDIAKLSDYMQQANCPDE